MTARSQSQSLYGRRRSNTAQSVLRPVPLKYGDSTVLSAWVQEPSSNRLADSDFILNHDFWPGVTEGDLIYASSQDANEGFLFLAESQSADTPPQLQFSIAKTTADVFKIRNHMDLRLIKVQQADYSADYVEMTFQDQYLGRSDMWRLGENLAGKCLHVGQDIIFLGFPIVKVHSIFIKGKKVASAYISRSSKIVYRSLSAKITIFIQVCKELWEFANDGERYYEKIVHSFLPELFERWTAAGTNHIITIVLISRVFYDQTEIEYAAGPLQRSSMIENQWFKDFYKVIADLELIRDWKATLVALKNAFWAFQRDILLTHHYHRATAALEKDASQEVRLVGTISAAHDGPILEALNIALNPTEQHYVDRSLSLTGTATILVTPGAGYFRVSKQLLRLTTNRMLDQGFGLDLISLSKPPLHKTPIFAFSGTEPQMRSDTAQLKGTGRALDPLWGGNDLPQNSALTSFWWQPFWISMTFWDKQVDLPFRQDRFVAQCKIHELQMLGLLEHDVLSSIEVPPLHQLASDESGERRTDVSTTRSDAEQFDQAVFTLHSKPRGVRGGRLSVSSSNNSGTIMGSSVRSIKEIPNPALRAAPLAKFDTIDESPQRKTVDLPQLSPSGSGSSSNPSMAPVHKPLQKQEPLSTGLSASPSQASVHSNVSGKSDVDDAGVSQEVSQTGAVRASRFSPAWLLKAIRGGPTQPQTSTISASPSLSTTSTISHIPSEKSTTVNASEERSRQPLSIRNTRSRRSTNASRLNEDDQLIVPRGNSVRGYGRSPPYSASPLNDNTLVARRSSSFLSGPFTISGSPVAHTRSNPMQLNGEYTPSQATLATRWQHLFPQTIFQHQVKWKSMVTPACLPLTVEYFPTQVELDSSYDVTSYEFLVPSPDMRSFLVKLPQPSSKTQSEDELRRHCALVVLRGMAALRVAQGFQFLVSPQHHSSTSGRDHQTMQRAPSFAGEDASIRKPVGISEVLKSASIPCYLSMSNEIHRISFTGEQIQVMRYIRRMPSARPHNYECLIWPKLGTGYTEQAMTFTARGLENYGWNRMDMLVAGYEHQFNESLRYWRTRFVVIPSLDPPPAMHASSGERLSDEEIHLLGADKLAEHFAKVRWVVPSENPQTAPLTRFLPTSLEPAAALQDEIVLSQLEEIHASGPLKKRLGSELELDGIVLKDLAKAMRDDDTLPVKDHKWHNVVYSDSFTGYEFVSWLAREFKDVATREQGVEWGVRFMQDGFLEHCRQKHGFLDGHYFYRVTAEYAPQLVPQTPSSGNRWFRPNRQVSLEEKTAPETPRSNIHTGLLSATAPSPTLRRSRRHISASQTIVIDVDTNKRSDRAETAILHHDIMHNPATAFHFELNWIGTNSRCIEDLLRSWSRSIDRFGLKLVETYVDQICDVRENNAFQSCFPIPLALPPPVLDLDHPYAVEHLLLKKFGFAVDVEVMRSHDDIDVHYTYRRSSFSYSQFVHRSGIAFVQVLGGQKGFLFLTNRLFGPGRMGTSIKSRESPAVSADALRLELLDMCSDSTNLSRFYGNIMDQNTVSELKDPPPLEI